MSIWQIIDDFKNMPEPDRRADKTIAEIIGMREKVVGGTQYWVLGEKLFHRVPAFTSSVDAAMIAVEIAGPVKSGGVTFGLSPATATVNDDEYCEGATPAIALCVAALIRMARGK